MILYSRRGEKAYLNANMVVDIYSATDTATFAVLVNGEIALIEEDIMKVKEMLENE